jgi:hypothetical protein
MWTISLLSDGPEEYYEFILSENILLKINEYSIINISSIQIPCLRIIGNLLSGENDFIEKIIKTGVIKNLFLIAKQNFQNIDILENASWCLLNLSKSNSNILNEILEDDLFCHLLNKIFSEIKNQDILMKFIKIIINFIKNGNENTTTKLIHYGLFSILEKCVKNNQNNFSLLNYVFIIFEVLISVDELELKITNYLNDFSKQFSLNHLSDVLSLINQQNFKKEKAENFLNKNFLFFLTDDNLFFKEYLFNYINNNKNIIHNNVSEIDSYSKLENIYLDLSKRIDRIKESIKFSEILFDFTINK